MFTARVDAKGRFKLPSAFQKFFESKGVKNFYITSRDEKTVYIAPLELWKEFEEILNKPATEELAEAFEAMRFKVSYYGGDGVIDGEGRLSLSQELRKKFGLVDSPVWMQFNKGAIQMFNEAEFRAREAESNADKLAKAQKSLALLGF